MRVATCIHKNNRLALCESQKCYEHYKRCTVTKLVSFISDKVYFFIIDRVISEKKPIEEVLKL